MYILHLKSNLNRNFKVKPVDVTQSFISSGQVSRFSFRCTSQGCRPKSNKYNIRHTRLKPHSFKTVWIPLKRPL